MIDYVIVEQNSDNVKKSYKLHLISACIPRFPMTVSEIFSTENPKLISIFFEKFDDPEDNENSGFISQDDE